MRALKIAQDCAGTPLRQPSAPYQLPVEEEAARRAVAALQRKAAKVRRVHSFRTGMGLAAPQIGIRRRVAIVYLADRNQVITLLNPQVVEQSAAVETRFEGCLSFFDVRGQVTRPVHLLVSHQHFDGTTVATAFAGSVARLVAHEIDHLDGILYTERMAAGDRPMPVEHYRAHHYGAVAADASGTRGTTPGSVGSSR